jgi:hypothetical protein
VSLPHRSAVLDLDAAIDHREVNVVFVVGEHLRRLQRIAVHKDR